MTRVDVKRAGVRLPSGGYGCARPLAMFGTVWIVLASFAMSQWDTLQVLARVGAIIFLVLGILCTLPLLGLWTLKLWVKRFTTNLVTRIQTAGAEETQRQQDLYGGDLQYRPAEESDLTGTERDQYERTTSGLLAAGCTLVGDVVNVKADQAGDAAGVQRMMGSADGRSWLVVLRDGATAPENPLTVEIVSEFLDQTFCCTSNSSAISLRTLPPQLRMDILPPDKVAAQVVQQHEASLKMLTSSEAMVFSALADVLASQRRKYVLTMGFRKMIGS